ncbi:hypothetical protein [Zobellia galactanivorans]|uniref:hypothetical protein n=1 Tax=Zobellia galactanivorans (strain DSM 12802 / CCUG 47099 / CIP 106680 / NCIMB 13871 / Dsij) TaxID=63186 RepID=UPI001C075E51|nr:hypothetical protein [Zobellia galactanivorans]MBU3026028.1 hypothetical protein [Zobellia galactanivorans]
MTELLFLIKLAVAIVFVIGLSLLAENVSPKVAGILSGYPTGSAITLFFFGLEVSPDYAAKSAVYNMIGLTAALSFVYIYYIASKYFVKLNILLSSLSAILGYFIIVWLLHLIEINIFLAIAIPIAFALLYIYLFREIKNITIETKAKLNFKILFVRAFFAALIILLITSVPKFVGPNWAGLFSAFPTTLFPLMLIIHYTYSKEHVHTVIKNVPIGMFSLIIYSLAVSIVYPLFGIYLGTLISFGTATLYLLVYSKTKSLINNRKRVVELKKRTH